MLPSGLGHADYAPRNVLVAPAGRVAVIDTSARWWYPVDLDVGYFLAGLRMLLPRALTGELLPTAGTLDAVEPAFLNGYFGKDPVARVENGPHPARCRAGSGGA